MRNLVRCSIVLLGLSVAFPALAVGLQMGHRPEIGAIDAPKKVKAGEPVKITITTKKDGDSGCGLLVKFGDGADRQMKINRDEGKFPVTLEHVYKKDGNYQVTANGKEITTNKGCKGSATAMIQVGEPAKPAKADKSKKSDRAHEKAKSG
jgi:PKD domain